MCRQTLIFAVLIAGLILLLLCFIPNWLIFTAGIVLIAAGIWIAAVRLKKKK